MNDSTLAFGVIPMDIIEHLKSNSDWKMKLKMVEDLEEILNEMNHIQRQQFMNYASAFITFVEETLLTDDNMKILLSGIRILSK